MIYFASRTGNVQAVVKQLGLPSINIADIGAPPRNDFVLFTYTDGLGDVPGIVQDFMVQYGHLCKGIICSGNTNYGQNFCVAGITLSEKYSVPLGCKLDLRGKPSDLDKIRKFYEQVIK